MRGQLHEPVFVYAAYGLVIASDMKVAGLEPMASSQHPDVRLWATAEPAWLERVRNSPREPWRPLRENGTPLSSVYRGPWLIENRFIECLCDDGAVFIIDIEGGDVWATWPDSVSPEDIAAYFVGSALGTLLAARGIPVLHAAAVLIDGTAVALMGEGGAGKSTTCAALSLREYPVITEDVLALHVEEGRFMVQPGYPLVRLWPDSTSYLFADENELRFITPGWKKWFEVGTERRPFHASPAPLSAIYYLGGRTSDPKAPWIEPVSRAEALVKLVANTYATRRQEKGMRADEFRTLAPLAAGVTMRQVMVSSDPRKIGTLCEAIIADHRRLQNPALTA